MPRPIRPPAKPCAWEGCNYPKAKDFKYCGKHVSMVRTRLAELPGNVLDVHRFPERLRYLSES